MHSYVVAYICADAHAYIRIGDKIICSCALITRSKMYVAIRLVVILNCYSYALLVINYVIEKSHKFQLINCTKELYIQYMLHQVII